MIIANRSVQINISEQAISDFCKRWHIEDLALFGSVVREDFNSDSDVDVLISLPPDVFPSVTEWLAMIRELSSIFGRPVDLLTRATVERDHNSLFKASVLNSTQTMYTRQF